VYTIPQFIGIAMARSRSILYQQEERTMKFAGLLTALVLAYPLAAHADFWFTRYGTVKPASGWSFVAGQFAGDSRADVTAYHPSDGSLWVGRNAD
jgi:hypothetical protein